jgi:hypothetical protein
LIVSYPFETNPNQHVFTLKKSLYEEDDAFISFGRKCKNSFIGCWFSGLGYVPVIFILVRITPSKLTFRDHLN